MDKCARYLRYRLPSNWLREAPLEVKNVPSVPSGPTKLNGPDAEFEPATWNRKLVSVGSDPFHDSVNHSGIAPVAGLLSFSDETRFPELTKFDATNT